MMNVREIIIAPLITEKSSSLRVKNNSYVFKVSKNANKIEIKKAIEKIFSVGVDRVNTINNIGKNKTVGKYKGKTSSWKKAIVTLKQGYSIPEFEV